jgi:hypothetical protein
MRLVAIALCSVMFAGSAVAQPGVCNVTIVRAPDAVREVVEGWVRAEPRCTGTLEVRIVPTDGGYYLFARDASGRIRERVVPDPQSAGVLIASWAADDTAPAPPPPPPRPMAPPSLVVPTQDPFVDAPPRAPRSYRWGGWLTLGYVTAGDTDGLRAEADIVTRGALTTGVSLSLVHYELPVGVMYENVTGRDLRVAVYGSDTLRLGPASLRIGLGVGAFYTDSYLFDGTLASGMSYGQTGWSSLAEGSVELGLDLTSRWSLMVGVVGSLFDQAWVTGEQGEFKRYGDIMGTFGLRWRP